MAAKSVAGAARLASSERTLPRPVGAPRQVTPASSERYMPMSVAAWMTEGFAGLIQSAL